MRPMCTWRATCAAIPGRLRHTARSFDHILALECGCSRPAQGQTVLLRPEGGASAPAAGAAHSAAGRAQSAKLLIAGGRPGSTGRQLHSGQTQARSPSRQAGTERKCRKFSAFLTGRDNHPESLRLESRQARRGNTIGGLLLFFFFFL